VIFTLQLGGPRIAPELEKRILSHLRKGVGILKIAELCCVGTATVQRIKAEMSGPFDAASAAARENRKVSYTVCGRIKCALIVDTGGPHLN
jgi:hypothetical protein